MSKRFFCIVSVLLLSNSFISAADADTQNEELARLRASFDKEMQKIDDEDLGQTLDAQEQYVTAMKNLAKKFTGQNNSDAASAVNDEILRFGIARSVDENNVVGNVPDLAQIQRAYVKDVEKRPLEKSKKVIALAKNYEKSLKALSTRLTGRNDTAGAKEADAEMEALKSRKEVSDAELVVAAAQTVVKPAETATKKQPSPLEAAKEKTAEKAVVKTDERTKKKSSATHEKRVRQRYEEFTKLILKQEYDKASSYIDPDFVSEHGEGDVKRLLTIVFPFLKAADDPRRKLGVDSVSINDDSTECTLVPKVWNNNKWHTLRSTKWMISEDEWYLDVTGVADQDEKTFQKENRNDMSAPPRFPPRKFRRK